MTEAEKKQPTFAEKFGLEGKGEPVRLATGLNMQLAGAHSKHYSELSKICSDARLNDSDSSDVAPDGVSRTFAEKFGLEGRGEPVSSPTGSSVPLAEARCRYYSELTKLRSGVQQRQAPADGEIHRPNNKALYKTPQP